MSAAEEKRSRYENHAFKTLITSQEKYCEEVCAKIRYVKALRNKPNCWNRSDTFANGLRYCSAAGHGAVRKGHSCLQLVRSQIKGGCESFIKGQARWQDWETQEGGRISTKTRFSVRRQVSWVLRRQIVLLSSHGILSGSWIISRNSGKAWVVLTV